MIRFPRLCRPVAAALTLLCLLLHAQAEVQRLAVLVGMNRGLDDERPLRYASRDAREMASLLRRSGAFDKNRIYLHADEGLDKVKASLAEVAGRVKEIRRGGAQTLVLFFYSGHGSSAALHIGGKRWPREEVNRAVESLDSDIKIVILDACESGDFLRAKGGRVLEGEGVRLEDSLGSRGTLILTSSSRGELSQESENYRGAIFSHHLMNGMRGMADYNRDRAVTVLEAFDYARETTRLERVGGRDPAQNPSFDVDLVGREDPVLTRIPPGLSRLTLVGMPWAPLEIYDAGTLDLAYRVWLTGKDSLAFTLPAGKYVLCLHNKSSLMTRALDLSWEKEVTAHHASFSRRPASTLFEKGRRALQWNPQGIRVAVARAAGRPGPDLGMVLLGYEHRGYRLHRIAEAGIGTGSRAGEEFLNEALAFRGSAGGKLAFARWSVGQTLAGFSLSGDWLRQKVTDKRLAGPIDGDGGTIPRVREFSTLIGRLSVGLEEEFQLPWGLWIAGGISGGAYAFSLRGEDGWTAKPEWSPALAAGRRF